MRTFWRRRPRRRGVAGGLALMAAGLSAGLGVGRAEAQERTAQVCRQGQVEWIIGGPAPACAGAQRLAAEPAAPARPAGEARVSAGTQAERDKDRRRILAEELARERQTLADMTRPGQPADPARLNRTQANLAALEQELARVRP